MLHTKFQGHRPVGSGGKIRFLAYRAVILVFWELALHGYKVN